MDSLVSQLLDVEHSTLGTDITVPQILDSVDDGRTDSSCYSVVVRLSHSSDSSDVGFQQVVLRQVYTKVNPSPERSRD